MKFRLALLVALLQLLPARASAPGGLYVPAPPAPKRELRAVWVTTLGGLDWPGEKASTPAGRERQKRELRGLLDRLQSCRVNTVLLQTRVRGSVIYPSRLEPWDEALTGRPGGDPGYDPLAFAVDEAHRRGMELHAWVVAVPAFKDTPAGRARAKALMRTSPGLLLRHRGMWYLDPGQPAAAAYLARLCGEIAGRYDVDGIHLDYIRYPEEAASFPDAATFRRHGRGMARDAWRRANVTRMVAAAAAATRAAKPWARLSCSPVGKFRDVARYSARGWDAYRAVHQDAQAWLRDGLMDMLLPMMYFLGDHFYPFAADWQEQSAGRVVAPGLGIYFMHPKEKDWPLPAIERELCYLRAMGTGGQAYFRARFLADNTKGLLDYLRRSFYPWPALTPAMTWRCRTRPDPPRGLRLRQEEGARGRLTWQGREGERYVVYAAPTAPVDTGDPRNIVRVTPGTDYEYSLLTARLLGLHLAVTALDRYGNESEPSEP